jgi:hypothetical protein
VAGTEAFAVGLDDEDLYVVPLACSLERFVELVHHLGRLSIRAFGPIEDDSGDRSVFFIQHHAEVDGLHDELLSGMPRC